MARFKYDPTRVRAEFRRKYCHEFEMPSGKLSGMEMFPITDEEINNLMGDCEFDRPSSGEHVTISEWMLWSALRLKYGVNYLNPRPKCMRAVYERTYKEDEEDNDLELRMQNYVDHEMQYFNEKFLDKINEGQKSTVKTISCMEEDFKKYFKKNLDIVDF